ncbi:glutathione binding-like protein, partial [Gilvimarinus sp. 1_MG-2023]
AAPEPIPYALNRYWREARRHYSVLNTHLASRTFIVGEQYSIADIAAWGWIDKATVVLGDDGALSEFPHLKAWFDRINSRPAVERARTIGQHAEFQSELDDA